MKSPSRVALELLLAAGAVVASGNAAGADPAPPCGGWQTAAQHSDAAPVESFARLCAGGAPEGGYAFKQGFPIKWQGGG